MALAHQMLFSAARVYATPTPGGFGLGTMVQVEPSQRSANVVAVWGLCDCDPTARQLLGLAHDTPTSAPPPRGGLALATVAQLDPLPRTTRGCSTPELSTNQPTAVQLVALVHEIPDNAEFELGGPGVPATDHPVDAPLTPALAMMAVTATSAVAATRHDPRVAPERIGPRGRRALRRI